MPIPITAYHEAAHAVAAIALDIGIIEVTFWDFGERDSSGGVAPATPMADLPREIRMLVALAGPAAEVVLWETREETRSIWTEILHGDMNTALLGYDFPPLPAEDFVAYIGGLNDEQGALLAEAACQAERLVRRQWAAVCQIAETLWYRWEASEKDDFVRLTGAECVEIFLQA